MQTTYSPFERNQVAIVSHQSAWSYYRTLEPAGRYAAKPCNDYVLADASTKAGALEGLNLDYPGFGSSPIEFLVPSESQYRKTSAFITRSCKAELPKDSFWKFNERHYIVSPELCFVQMAQSLSLAQLVELGTNLCAPYYIDLNTDKPKKRNPITTPNRLSQFVGSATGVIGAAKARKALDLISPDSASPMETKQYVLVRFPKCYGGYGMKGLKLNHKVNPGRYSYLAEQGYFEIDLCWPKEHVGMEYFGENEHQDHIHDRRRLDALEALGYHVVVIDKQRLKNPDSFDIAMKQVARHLKYSIRKPQNWEEKNLALRRELGLLMDV